MKTGRWNPKLFAAVGIVLAIVAAIAYANYRYNFPYGSRHCCDLLLFDALQEYASTHRGEFPAGQASPEASLSLLYSNVPWAIPDLLCGQTVPKSTAKAILSRGELLSAESCGWHYVQGLSAYDDPRLALFWDKAGLDHSGKRLPKGGHVVMLLNKDRKYVPARDWPKFLEEQKRLWAARTNGTEITVSTTTQIKEEPVRLQLRVMDDYLLGQVWRGGGWSGGMIAHIDRDSGSGVVGMPVVAKDEVRSARVETNEQTGQIHFVLGTNRLVFDGNDLRFANH